MTDARFRRPRRIRGAVIGDLRYGDVGPVSARVNLHAYLDCWQCSHWLYVGRTDTGATVFACRSCATITDVRRVP